MASHRFETRSFDSVSSTRSMRMLRTSTALASLLAIAGFAVPAHAADECGAAVNGTLTCTASGNPYAGGISYVPAGNLSLTTNSDVAATNTVSVNGTGATHVTNNGTITTTLGGTAFSPGAQGIYARGTTVTVDGTGMIMTSGLNARGIDAATTGNGALTVNVGDITTTGTGGGGPGFFPNSSAIFVNSDAGAIDVTAGTLQTAGDFASGVQALSNTGDISADTGSITTTGANANGVLAQTYGTGTAAVVSTGTISTSGQTANGVTIYSRNGTATANVGNVNATGVNAAGILVNGSTAANATFDSISTGGSFGQGVYAQSGGDVTVSGNNVTTAGTDAAAIYAFSDTGHANVTTIGTIATTGGSSRGVYAYSNTGDANVSVNNVTTTGNNSGAVVAHGANATVTVSGNVSTQGTAMYSPAPMDGVIADATAGDAKVTNNGIITTAGDNSSAIIVSGTNSATVDGTGSAATSGSNADAIVATSAGNVSVAQNKVSTTGDYSRGVVATSTGTGNVDVDVATVSTTGTAGSSFFFLPNSAGIVATAGSGDVTVTNGSVSTVGQSATGIRAGSYSGDVMVNAGSVTTTGGEATGIQAIGNYGGNVVVNSTGTVSTVGDSAYGIYEGARQGTVAVNAGTVATQGSNADAIRAIGDTSSAVTFGNVSTAGAFASGIDAEATGDVTVSGGNVTTSAVDAPAIYAFSNTGNASVTTTGTVSTTGASSRGIYAYSNTGNATVVANNVTTTGNNGDAIVANGANSSVTVNGTVSTQGTQAYSSSFADAVNVKATDGVATIVNNGAISTAGAQAFGIAATGTQGVTISGSGSTATTGQYARAIDAYSMAGPVSITTGSLSTQGDFADAVHAHSYSGNVSVNTGAVSTAGLASAGINAYNASGNITVNSGNISTTGKYSNGVTANGNGAVSVTAAAVKTSGNNATGVLALSNSGPVTVNVGSVAVTGAQSNGIDVLGGGTVLVTSGTASSADAAAIYATSTGGAATVSLNGATTGGNGPAVLVDGATSATLNLGSGGSLAAVGGGAQLTGVTGETVNNGGTIAGNGSAAILTATGGSLTFNNSGSFTGIVGFTAGNDTVNNSGTYAANYDQDFGAGTDTFNNSETFKALPGASTAGTVHLTALEAFNNSGLVDLRSGHAGDVLSTSSTFTGSGASTLGIDVALGANGSDTLADRLTAAGAITGNTTLLINRIGANGAFLNPGTVFAVGGAGSSATAFSANLHALDQGFIQYGVSFNAANNSYSLVGTPNDAVFRTLKINEGAQQLWYKSAEAWSSHMSDLRDAKFAGGGADGGRIWGQFYGSAVTRNDAQNVSAFGQSRTADLSYRQDAYGAQAGMDLGSRDMGAGNFVFGVTGGYLNSDLTFTGSADRTNYSVVNIGAYASYVSGHLFANALGKYDYIWANSTSVLAGYHDKFHGMSYGAQGEVGFRLGGDSFYAEPVATIAYVRTDLKDIHALGQTIDFDNLDGLRGKAGLRVGSKMDMGGGSIAVIYAQGNYVHEFKGEDGIRFISGGQSLAYNNDPIGDYGEGKIGFNVTTPGGVTGFIEGFGDYAKHGDYKGGGGRAGIRVKF